MLFDIPLDVLGLILGVWLKPVERISLRFVNKRLSELGALKNDKGRKYLKHASVWAASNGHHVLIEWIASKLPKTNHALLEWSSDLYLCAAHGGHIRVLTWLRAANLGVGFNRDVSDIAAEKGYLHILKYLRNDGVTFTAETCARAALGNQFETLKWIRGDKECSINEHTVTMAVEKGNMEMLKWALGEGCSCPPITTTLAAQKGNLPMLQFLVDDLGIHIGEGIIDGAVRSGDIPTTQWLLDRGCPLDQTSSCESAANGGHLEMLKWLAGRGGHVTGICAFRAAQNGHLGVLKWLHSQNYYMWSDAWHGAAMGGHFELLKWLKATGIPWDRHVGTLALKRGEPEILKWLVEHEYPFFKDLSQRGRAKLEGLLK
jgi:hypothetical protein